MSDLGQQGNRRSPKKQAQNIPECGDGEIKGLLDIVEPRHDVRVEIKRVSVNNPAHLTNDVEWKEAPAGIKHSLPFGRDVARNRDECRHVEGINHAPKPLTDFVVSATAGSMPDHNQDNEKAFEVVQGEISSGGRAHGEI